MELVLLQTSVAAIMDGTESIAIHVSQCVPLDFICSPFISFSVS